MYLFRIHTGKGRRGYFVTRLLGPAMSCSSEDHDAISFLSFAKKFLPFARQKKNGKVGGWGSRKTGVLYTELLSLKRAEERE
jgi:hypothetical protein